MTLQTSRNKARLRAGFFFVEILDMRYRLCDSSVTATHNRGDEMNNANHMQRQAETNYERAMQAARDQYTGYAEEDERNAAWAASYAEYMADCASGESDDWLGYIKEADCILMAAARRDPDAAEAGRKMGEVLQLIWERGAACTADAECERVWGW